MKITNHPQYQTTKIITNLLLDNNREIEPVRALIDYSKLFFLEIANSFQFKVLLRPRNESPQIMF